MSEEGKGSSSEMSTGIRNVPCFSRKTPVMVLTRICIEWRLIEERFKPVNHFLEIQQASEVLLLRKYNFAGLSTFPSLDRNPILIENCLLLYFCLVFLDTLENGYSSCWFFSMICYKIMFSLYLLYVLIFLIT